MNFKYVPLILTKRSSNSLAKSVWKTDTSFNYASYCSELSIKSQILNHKSSHTIAFFFTNSLALMSNI